MGIWNNITNKAWNDNQIIYAMDQMQTAGAKAPAGCTGGYCFGLAAVWIKRKWQFRDYAYDSAAYEYWDTDWLAVDVQKTYDAELAKATHTWTPIANAYTKAGLKLQYGKSQASSGAIHGSGLYNIIENGEGATKGGNGTYIVGMKGTYGAHAVAIFNGGDRWWSLFDGNFGAFRMQGNNDFKQFLHWYFGSGATNYKAKYGDEWLTACAVPAWA